MVLETFIYSSLKQINYIFFLTVVLILLPYMAALTAKQIV